MKPIHKACAALAAFAAADAAASCGSAFCLINTDWSAQGAWVEQGARFDLHYEYINLDQPRSGTHDVAVGEIPRDHDEVETRNRNLVATVDWTFAPRWGLSLAVPYVDRYHLHLEGGEPETWDFRDAGDMRAQMRYLAYTDAMDPEAPRAAGLTFGLKLPTGKHDVANAAGELAERTLQPGTGTTDAVLGVYWNGAAPLTGWSWFTRAVVQLPFNEADGYKPGKQLMLDGGVRYGATRDVGLMLQMNYHAKGRDSGQNAEPEDSGQRSVYVSPGISWNATQALQLYAFFQLPVYQAVNGVQLVARKSALAGMTLRF